VIKQVLIAALVLTMCAAISPFFYPWAYRLALRRLHNFERGAFADPAVAQPFAPEFLSRLYRYGVGDDYEWHWDHPVTTNTGGFITLREIIVNNCIATSVVSHAVVGLVCAVVWSRRSALSPPEGNRWAFVSAVLVRSSAALAVTLAASAIFGGTGLVALRFAQAAWSSDFNDDLPGRKPTHFAQDHAGWLVSMTLATILGLMVYRALAYPRAKQRVLTKLGRCTRCGYPSTPHRPCSECGQPTS
jgi:hypothetical protein